MVRPKKIDEASVESTTPSNNFVVFVVCFMMNGAAVGHGRPKEVDFYKDPTILSRLILNERYDAAMNRLEKFPEEVSVWVCSKRNPFQSSEDNNSSTRTLQRYPSLSSFQSNRSLRSVSSIRRKPSLQAAGREIDPDTIEFSLRQLPIHVACNNFLSIDDEYDDVDDYDNEVDGTNQKGGKRNRRADLERLVIRLAVKYPEGCGMRDHEGKLPLHEALWNNASTETITVLLMAYPTALHERDRYGRSPVELNRFRRGEDHHKSIIQKLLLRGVQFWEKARAVIAQQEQQQVQQQQAAETRASEQLPLQTPKNIQANTIKDKRKARVEAMTWAKLERRAIHLEQLLNGMYEKNYELGELVEELRRENQNLQETLDQEQQEQAQGATWPGGPRQRDQLQELKSLEEERDVLRQRIEEMERALHEATTIQQRLEVEKGDNDDVAVIVRAKNTLLQRQVDELTERNGEVMRKNDRLEMIVDALKQGGSIIHKEAEQEEKDTLNDDERETLRMGNALNSLIDSLQSTSSSATERYLATKIVNLEEELWHTRESHMTSTTKLKEENRRLLQENELLAAQVNSLGTAVLLQRGPTTTELTSTKKNDKRARMMKKQSSWPLSSRSTLTRSSAASSAAVPQDDDLEKFLSQAAAMYSNGAADDTVLSLSSTTAARQRHTVSTPSKREQLMKMQTARSRAMLQSQKSGSRRIGSDRSLGGHGQEDEQVQRSGSGRHVGLAKPTSQKDQKPRPTFSNLCLSAANGGLRSHAVSDVTESFASTTTSDGSGAIQHPSFESSKDSSRWNNTSVSESAGGDTEVQQAISSLQGALKRALSAASSRRTDSIRSEATEYTENEDYDDDDRPEFTPSSSFALDVSDFVSDDLADILSVAALHYNIPHLDSTEYSVQSVAASTVGGTQAPSTIAEEETVTSTTIAEEEEEDTVISDNLDYMYRQAQLSARF